MHDLAMKTPTQMFPKRPKSRILLYIGTLPLDVLWGWPLVFFGSLFWGVKGSRLWTDGVLRAKVRRDSWLGRRFQGVGVGNVKINVGAVTISAHAHLYIDGELWPEDLVSPSPYQHHEHHHSEQMAAQGMVGAFDAFCISLLGLASAFGGGPTWLTLPILVWAFLTWLLPSAKAGQAAKYTSALLGEADTYRGAHNEEGAYAKQRDSQRG